MNRTKVKSTGKTPLDAAKGETKPLSEAYNRKRGKDSGNKIRRRPLKVGERVRYQLIPSGHKKMDYKAYKKETWSKQIWPAVTAIPERAFWSSTAGLASRIDSSRLALAAPR